MRKIKNKFSPEKRGKNGDIQQQINENRAKLKGKTPVVYSDNDYVMDEEGKTIKNNLNFEANSQYVEYFSVHFYLRLLCVGIFLLLKNI